MSEFPPLEESRLKIERARYHLAQLEREISSFLAQRPFRVVLETRSDGRFAWTFRIKPIPKEFSAIIGDVVHNLRAALDLAACDLVRLNKQSDKDVYFPFAKDATELEKMIKARHIDRAGSDIVELVQALKPYKGGNTKLRAIHDLDISDKHRALIPVANKFSPVDFKIGGNSFIGNSEGRFLDGDIFLLTRSSSGFKVGQEFPGTGDLSFQTDWPLERKSIVAAMRELCDLTEDIIAEFKRKIQRRLRG